MNWHRRKRREDLVLFPVQYSHFSRWPGLLIYAIQSSAIGTPFNYDAVAFWAHSICVRAALVHIKYGIHDDEWEPGLQVLKAYLRSFEPRYKIYGM